MRNIFVNLPVNDLAASKAFFAGLGFTFNPQFTDDNAACMVIEQNIFAMLLTRPFFQGFLTGAIADPANGTEVLVALSCDSREEVDDMLSRAFAGGARTWRPEQDHGFMYQGSFQDPDGHVWELVWMDPSFVQDQPGDV